MSPELANVLAALSGRGLRRVQSGWIARCPGHDDQRASLSIGQGADGRVLLYCHAGCEVTTVVEHLSLGLGDLMPERSSVARPSSVSEGRGEEKAKREAAVYAYRDEGGVLLFEVVRFDPKGFAQRRPDGRGGWIWGMKGVRRVLYRLPELLAASDDAVVYVVEGEKDADRLAGEGFVATTSPGGAGKWRLDFGGPLRGRRVVVLPDNDESGVRHAQDVAEALRGIATQVVVLELDGLPPKGDVSDWFDAGHTAAELRDLCRDELASDRDGDNAKPERCDHPRGGENAEGTPMAGFSGRRPCVSAHVVTLSTLEARQVEWLWSGRLPAGMVTVLDGQPAAGKSTVVIDLIARLTTGREFPDETPGERRAPADVLLIGHEDSPEHTILPRVIAAGGDPARVHLLTEISGRMPQLPEDIPAIEAVIREKGARVLVVDPISAYIGHADFHRDNEVRAALGPLAALANALGTTVLMVRHLRKSGGADALNRGLGSVAVTALARAGLTLVGHPTKPGVRVLAWSKMSIAQIPQSLEFRLESTGDQPPRIAWVGTCDLTADDLLAAKDRKDRGGPAGSGANVVDEAEAWLTGFFEERGEAPATEITERAAREGISEKALRAARRRLGVRHRRENVEGGERGKGRFIWSAPGFKLAKSISLGKLNGNPGSDGLKPASGLGLQPAFNLADLPEWQVREPPLAKLDDSADDEADDLIPAIGGDW